METNEQNIIQDCQKGNLEKFALLYDLYVKKIYDFLYYRTSHKETAEDLTSLVFTKALEKISGYNKDKAQFSTWLYQIARNTLIDHYRQNKPESGLDDALQVAGNQNVEKEISFKLELEKVVSLLNEFNPEQKDVVLMRVWDGLLYKEIAEITGKSEAACKMLFARAMEKLNKEIVFALLYLLFLKP